MIELLSVENIGEREMADILTPDQRQQQNNEAEARRAAMANQVAALRAQRQQQQQNGNSNDRNNNDQKADKSKNQPKQEKGGSMSDKYGGTHSVYPDHNIGNLFGQIGISASLIGYDIGKPMFEKFDDYRKNLLERVGEPELEATDTAAQSAEQKEAESTNRLSL